MPEKELLQEETIDLKEYLRVLKKWRWVIILITFLAMLTSAFFSYFVLPPVYEARTVLMVTQAASQQQTYRQQGEGLQGVVDILSRLPQMTMNTYVGQITSDSLLDKVIDSLKLDRSLYTASSLAKMIDARNIKDTNLIEVKVSHTNPRLATDIANTLNREFLNFLSENNKEQMSKSVEFLVQQSDNVKKDLEKAQAELKKFEAQPRGVGLLEQELAAKSSDLLKYQSNLSQTQMQVDLFQAGIAELSARLKNTPKTITYEDNTGTKPGKREESNPLYVNLEQLLSQKLVSLAESQAQLNSLAKAIAAQEKAVGALQADIADKRATQDRLQQDVDRLEKTYTLLTQKITETQIARSVNYGDTSVLVVSPATQPRTPVKPNKKLNVAIAGVLGIMVSVFLAFILEYFDSTIKTPEDVRRHLELPVLGSIPVMTGLDYQRK
ncbi:MAG: Wzz/FepE/Etk N-terminal domain-containing protein [Firmicutes bacterium]|nr:Wzz/FepE/Etk N-terminal domain-containing protein [Bacillota bacterium]